MLKFNSNHKNINGRLKNNFNKVWLRSAFLGGALVSSIMLFSGCAKDVECNVSEPHAHNYVNEESFDRLMISEKENRGDWQRQDDFVLVNEDIEELIKFENKKGLFRISQNKDKIAEKTATLQDYMEYEYKYSYYNAALKMPTTGVKWTTDPNTSRLTGKQRVVHHVYFGYKIVRNDKGKLEAVRSGMVDSIDDLPEDYIYVKENFISKVYYDVEPLNNLNQSSEYDAKQDENYNGELQLEYESQLKLVQ